ncbi:MAG: DUF2905 domain-containing protein [bacterium]|jgi:hypothetical protein
MLGFEGIGRMLLGIGGLLIIIGLFLLYGGRLLPLGRLPGDIFIQKGNFTFYFPLVTGLILSVILTLLLNIFGRR